MAEIRRDDEVQPFFFIHLSKYNLINTYKQLINMKIDNFEIIAKKVLKFLPTKSPQMGDTFYEIRILKPKITF